MLASGLGQLHYRVYTRTAVEELERLSHGCRELDEEVERLKAEVRNLRRRCVVCKHGHDKIVDGSYGGLQVAHVCDTSETACPDDGLCCYKEGGFEPC